MELLTVPAIIAVIEALKKAGLPTKYAPLIAIAIGLALGYAVDSITGGLLVGLSASGLYSGVKEIIK